MAGTRNYTVRAWASSLNVEDGNGRLVVSCRNDIVAAVEMAASDLAAMARADAARGMGVKVAFRVFDRPDRNMVSEASEWLARAGGVPPELGDVEFLLAGWMLEAGRAARGISC